jgi:hypothetical protein
VICDASSVTTLNESGCTGEVAFADRTSPGEQYRSLGGKAVHVLRENMGVAAEPFGPRSIVCMKLRYRVLNPYIHT